MIFWYSKQGVKLKIALGQDWLHQSGLRGKTGSNWFTETKIENERKNWIVCTRIFGRIWVTWSGSVLKFSFQLRPADCQNLIDIFHVLRNIQFNSDIKRPQCHWTLILISINMIRNWRGWGCLHHALLGACDEIAPSSHLQPGVHQPAHTSVQRKPGGYCIRPWLENQHSFSFNFGCRPIFIPHLYWCLSQNSCSLPKLPVLSLSRRCIKILSGVPDWYCWLESVIYEIF